MMCLFDVSIQRDLRAIPFSTVLKRTCLVLGVILLYLHDFVILCPSVGLFKPRPKRLKLSRSLKRLVLQLRYLLLQKHLGLNQTREQLIYISECVLPEGR